ncbi:hypothetical protein J7U46_19425 [Pelomonas sp. V22]|uniref:cation efflux protein, CzcI family n=1 Tax=Pelomonas sp. V22 TaxID=2822139 RepID=UPI0024A8C954|nr:cation efflux protein, CzcI family [Pelomonas sp. V22]MDI4635243.1 hypothetical protein [Pelomonas sp. V22]
MKRLIAILIAVLLPLQLAWGVAATYCQHETSVVTAKHFGHHTHVHEAAKQDAAKKASLKLQIDADCNFCHASPGGMLPELNPVSPIQVLAQVPVHLGDLGHPSAPQRAPERPKWSRLA